MPYHIVVARLTSYGMCHWSTRVRRASRLNTVPRELRATGRHVVRDLGLGGAHAGSFPGMFACTGKTRNARTRSAIHRRTRRKRESALSSTRSVRVSRDARNLHANVLKSPLACLKASAKQCRYVSTPPHRHAWDQRRSARVAARPTYVHSGNPTISRRSSSQSFMRAHSRLVRSVRLGAYRSRGLDSNAARKR